jgi:hypothetical protein
MQEQLSRSGSLAEDAQERSQAINRGALQPIPVHALSKVAFDRSSLQVFFPAMLTLLSRAWPAPIKNRTRLFLDTHGPLGANEEAKLPKYHLITALEGADVKVECSRYCRAISRRWKTKLQLKSASASLAHLNTDQLTRKTLDEYY